MYDVRPATSGPRSFSSAGLTSSMETIEEYLHNLYRVRPDFVYSVFRDFAKSCQTPMLVLPDDVAAHPIQTSDRHRIALRQTPRSRCFPGRSLPEPKARTINRARTFLKGRQTA